MQEFLALSQVGFLMLFPMNLARNNQVNALLGCANYSSSFVHEYPDLK